MTMGNIKNKCGKIGNWNDKKTAILNVRLTLPRLRPISRRLDI